MTFDKILPTSKKTKWKNTCTYIIVHHTWWWSYAWNCNVLSWDKWVVSCHFVIWVDWQIAKIWNPEDILWHAWVSNWWKLTWLNKYSIWIEVVWPWFTDNQRKATKELIIHLQNVYKIPLSNILRHKDITTRKVDIDDSFWSPEFKSWDAWKQAKLLNI